MAKVCFITRKGPVDPAGGDRRPGQAKKRTGRVCFITGKGPVRGNRIRRRGQTKKSGGIGTHVVKRTRRLFRPNLQRIRIILPSGEIKRVLVSVKVIKAGKIVKAI
jgi:large subunit ribosomal protein L28